MNHCPWSTVWNQANVSDVLKKKWRSNSLFNHANCIYQQCSRLHVLRDGFSGVLEVFKSSYDAASAAVLLPNVLICSMEQFVSNDCPLESLYRQTNDIYFPNTSSQRLICAYVSSVRSVLRLKGESGSAWCRCEVLSCYFGLSSHTFWIWSSWIIAQLYCNYAYVKL